MVALECALERAATGGATTGLSLLRSTGTTKSITIANQLLTLFLVASLASKSPEQNTGSGENNCATNTDANADDRLLSTIINSCSFVCGGSIGGGSRYNNTR